MNSKIEKFLLNGNYNDEVFESSAYQLKIHKEKYDDRFDIIYSKKYTDSLKQEKYEVSGYYDTKDHCLYEPDRWMEEKLPEESVIRTSHFSEIDKKMTLDLNEYLNKYCLDNAEKLKKIAQKKYNDKDDYRFNSYKKEVRGIFLCEDNPHIDFSIAFSSSEFTHAKDYYSVLISYLNDSNKIVEELSKDLLDQKEEDFGLELLLLDDKKNYLQEILLNKDDSFRDLYINKNILNSIKSVAANNLNITIEYNGKSFSFKYDYDSLKRDLLNGNTKNSHLYSSGYDVVSDFIRENAPEDNHDRYGHLAFDFSHITKITHGKNELYSKDIETEKEVEEDLEIER